MAQICEVLADVSHVIDLDVRSLQQLVNIRHDGCASADQLVEGTGAVVVCFGHRRLKQSGISSLEIGLTGRECRKPELKQSS